MSASVTPDLADPSALAALFAPVAGEGALGLAVSGGPDSLALMVLAARWANALENAPRLFVYSLDHGFRPEAADEVAMVGREAARLGLEFRPLSWPGERPETGLQEAARQARYQLIGAAMIMDGANVLLTAHHRADQAETILMRLAHGSGLDGLKGITALSEVEGVRIFRPLLDAEPSALAAVVKDAGLAPAHDPSNESDDYERVRWRKLLPALAREGLDSAALSRFAVRMAEADEALAQLASAAFSELVRFDGFGAASLSITPLTQLGPAVGRRVLSRILAVVGGRQKPRALGQVERLFEQIANHTLPKGTTLLGTVIRIKDDCVVIAREPGRALPEGMILPPQAALVWDDRFEITNVSELTNLTAAATDFFPRHRLEEVLGFKVTTPAEAIRTAPIVRDESGAVLALGGWSFDERIKITLLVE
ncbi:tRNA(Ile)-lysidine synthase [Devosia crocina]|uniref:tRNA(Ile)-lysidine synthase n=1 Tax=Devosia crocina TaxID=429728 RepID=A0A1I7MXF9_9HYPH|nr:tRNA lysidine(34) synthetase TilS [Devosia crocina]SFV27107.1 tRNA(Ile)-lysidine synthase [Devosia crocina]